MRVWIVALFIIVGFAASPSGLLAETAAPAAPATAWSGELKTKILDAMRLNRRAFGAPGVLLRSGEERLKDHPAFATCHLTRTKSGDPASLYPSPKAQVAKRVVTDLSVLRCLESTTTLDGKPLNLLARHYYCALPDLSPDIRSCFAFQIRPDKVSSVRSIVDPEGFLPDGTKVGLEKRWSFLGTDPEHAPDVAAVVKSCTTDGRPKSIENRVKKESVDVATIHPEPTRPLCWIAETQQEVFESIMSGAVNPPVADQVALIKEYYGCDTIESKISKTLYNAFCRIAVPPAP